MIKNNLNRVRETKFWYFFLKFILIPIFNFFWVYLINVQGKLMKVNFTKKLNENYSKFFLGKNDKKILRNVPEFKDIIHKINLHLTDKFLDEMKSKISAQKYELGHYLYNGKNFYIDMYPFIKEDLKKDIVDFALNNFNLAIVTDYLKVMPIISKISLNLNIPVPGSKEGGSMLWHKDDFGYKSLDLFLPLNEVNENNGPFFYVEKKNELGVFHKLKKIKKNALLGERNKIELKTFEEISSMNFKSFLSNIGDGIFIDSFTCYHRGGFCKSGDRLMLRISYTTPDSIDIIGKDNLNGFRYYDLYKIRNSNLSKFQKYILFKRNKFFKIQNVLMKLYRTFHFKSEELF